MRADIRVAFEGVSKTERRNPGRRRFLRVQGSAVLAVMLQVCACAAPPPVSYEVSSNKLLGRQGGVLLLVDSAIQIETVGSGDYFVVDEAEAGGKAAALALHRYLAESDIEILAEMVSVGAAKLNATGAPVLVADRVGSATRTVAQPLRPPEAVAGDPDYAGAIAVLSTYAFERAAVSGKQVPSGKNNPQPSISPEEFAKAAAIIEAHTRASSVVFLGVLGKSRSSALATVEFLGRMALGIGAVVATVGLGAGFYAYFIPGSGGDGMILEGALIDLRSGQLTWSNAVQVGGDPILPENVANTHAITSLFHGIMFERSSK